jgi:hypothetical protein
MGGYDNNRGQSQVLGAILIFSFLIAGLALVQVTVVPQQNKAAELSHQAVVDDDFSRLHSGLMNAAEQNQGYTAAVKLGMKYPSRFLTLNPSDPQGSLRTTELGSLDDGLPSNVDLDNDGDSDTLSDVCGINTQTKALSYSPNYNELSGVGTHGYENSVTYQSVDGNLAEYQQALISSRTIRLRPLVGDSISVSSGGSESIELYAGTTGEATISADSEITLPTGLSKPEWETIVDGTVVSITNYDKNTGEVTLNLPSGADFTFLCTPVGVTQSPDNNPGQYKQNSGGSSQGEDDDATVNPAGGDEVALTGVSSGSSTDLELTFANNNNNQRTITKVRVPYVIGPGGGNGNKNNGGGKYSSIKIEGDTVQVGSGTYTELSPKVTFSPSGSSDSTQVLTADDVPSSQNTGFALVVKIENASGDVVDTNTYFVNPSAG